MDKSIYENKEHILKKVGRVNYLEMPYSSFEEIKTIINAVLDPSIIQLKVIINNDSQTIKIKFVTI